MTCGACGEPLDPSDLFCEACGSVVGDRPGSDSTSGLGQTGEVSDRCAACGARFDDDGFCESCGKRRPEPTDHLETDLALAAAVSDRGLRHGTNEDSYALVRSGDRVAVVVCDGVSTSSNPRQGSKVAAQAAIAVLERDLDDPTRWEAAAAEAVAAAQQAVAAVPIDESRGYQSASATTVVLAVAEAGQVVVANVGDSRAYLVVGSGPGEVVSIDDSLVAQAILQGVPPEAAYAAPQAHQITAWLGRDAGTVVPHIRRVAFEGDALLVVCSDGVWNYAEAPDKLVAAAAPAEGTEPLTLARRLVDFGLEAGGADNLTAAVVLLARPPVP